VKQKISLIVAAIVLMVALTPAQAGTWRSTSGNMFHFYPGGGMTAYVQGNAYNGRWWWTSKPWQFQYNFGWKTCTVQIKGQGAVALAHGENPQYWTQMASRGNQEEKPDTTSWFMEQEAP
jgi:hypothetical protein